jgi:hypothetical protein
MKELIFLFKQLTISSNLNFKSKLFGIFVLFTQFGVKKSNSNNILGLDNHIMEINSSKNNKIEKSNDRNASYLFY